MFHNGGGCAMVLTLTCGEERHEREGDGLSVVIGESTAILGLDCLAYCIEVVMLAVLRMSHCSSNKGDELCVSWASWRCGDHGNNGGLKVKPFTKQKPNLQSFKLHNCYQEQYTIQESAGDVSTNYCMDCDSSAN